MSRPAVGLRRLAAAFLTVAVAATGLVTLSAGTAAASDSAMLASVNSSRAAKGLRALDWNAHLASVAGEQARRIARRGELYHNPNLAADVGNFRWVGENVGYGPTWRVVQNAFMDSPGHRANILDRGYTQIGIASVTDDKGRLWVAQVFRQPLATSSRGSSDGGSSTRGSAKGGASKASDTAANAPRSSDRDRPRSTAPSARSTTQASTASADARARARSDAQRRARRAAAKARATEARRAASAPAPRPTLADRISYAQATTADGPTDPVADSLAFAAVMSTVGS